jgi:hypothetical protein
MSDKHHQNANHEKASEPPRGSNADDKKLLENAKEKMDERLDEGVEETFPASDPVSVKITK